MSQRHPVDAVLPGRQAVPRAPAVQPKTTSASGQRLAVRIPPVGGSTGREMALPHLPSPSAPHSGAVSMPPVQRASAGQPGHAPTARALQPTRPTVAIPPVRMPQRTVTVPAQQASTPAPLGRRPNAQGAVLPQRDGGRQAARSRGPAAPGHASPVLAVIQPMQGASGGKSGVSYTQIGMEYDEQEINTALIAIGKPEGVKGHGKKNVGRGKESRQTQDENKQLAEQLRKQKAEKQSAMAQCRTFHKRINLGETCPGCNQEVTKNML